MRDTVSANGDHLVRIFDDWAEAITFADKAPRVAGNASRMESGSRNGFTGTASWKGARDLAISGWAEGAEKANDIAAALFARVSSLVEREEVAYDVEGMDFDIDRVLTGEPECWMRFEYKTEEGTGRRVLRVVLNCEVSSGLSKSVIIHRGAALLAVVTLLEFAGHGVELWVVGPIGTARHGATAGTRGLSSENRILVKRADQPLDPSRAAFALAHPSMLRRIMFALQERMPAPWSNQCHEGYGRILETAAPGDVNIGGAVLGFREWEDPVQTQKWIVEQLRACGVELHEK